MNWLNGKDDFVKQVINGEKFIVNPTDLLRINPGKIHQAIATDARIVLSWGMYDT